MKLTLPTIAVVTALLVGLLGFAAPAAPAEQGAQTGTAVFYSNVFHGRRTASGERYDKNKLTAAHKRLPYGTRVRVTNLQNDKSVVVKINDRMATRNSHIIDVSRRAARELGFLKAGSARVRLQVLD